MTPPALTPTRRNVLLGLGALPLASSSLAAVAPQTTLFRNVYLFDGTSNARVPRNVRVTGQFVSAISAGDIHAPADAVIIDGKGQTLMPGLTDAHWHMWGVDGAWNATGDLADDGLSMALIIQDAEYQLMRGFTTVRDVAGSVFGIKAAIDQGVIPGPRCFPSGAALSQTSGHGDPTPSYEPPASLGGSIPYQQRTGMFAIVDGVPQVLAATRAQLKKGASQIKMLAGGGVMTTHDPIDTIQFTPEEMRAVVHAAADWGTYVCAHVYTSAGIRRALGAGVISIEHGQQADDAACAMMAEKGAWLSTQTFEPGDNVLTPEQLVKANASIASGGWDVSVRLAKKHGVKVAFGTDLLARTRTSTTENRMLTRLGRVFSNAETLRIGTSGNCELFERSGLRNPYRAAKLGVIQEGAWADMLLIKGNPLDELNLIIDYTNNMLVIMKDGKIYKNMMP